MPINKVKLKDLSQNPSRAAKVIVESAQKKIPLTYENLLPLALEAYKTGKHRSEAYIKHELIGTIKWLNS